MRGQTCLDSWVQLGSPLFYGEAVDCSPNAGMSRGTHKTQAGRKQAQPSASLLNTHFTEVGPRFRGADSSVGGKMFEAISKVTSALTKVCTFSESRGSPLGTQKLP